MKLDYRNADKEDAKLDKYKFRETVTQKKSDDLMKAFKILFAYFDWHATHGVKGLGVREEAHTMKDLVQDSIKELKKIKIV